MFETFKTNQIRGRDFMETYFTGKVIDVGCGKDLVVQHAEPFDQQQGDANRILDFRPPESYDCVHSSHCLEHMIDPKATLEGWWGLVKPGGYLIVVVPDEDLYEQGVWPSRFNKYHTASFRLGREGSWSPVSNDLGKLFEVLPRVKIISAERHDHGYDRSQQRMGPEGILNQVLREKLNTLFEGLKYNGLISFNSPAELKRSFSLILGLNKTFYELGATVDQTRSGALAQIQIVAQKL